MTGPAVTLPPEVVIEALRVTDAARCAALEEVLFPGDEPWNAGAFREELRAGHTYLAARIDGELVGYGGVAVVGGPPGAEAEIHTIGVDPAHQGRGIGRAVLRGCSRPPTRCARRCSWRSARTTSRPVRSTRARGSRWSACGPATTGPAARTRTR